MGCLLPRNAPVSFAGLPLLHWTIELRLEILSLRTLVRQLTSKANSDVNSAIS